MSRVDSQTEPLIPSASDSDPPKVSTSLSFINLLLSAVLLILAYLLIKDQPDCDQPLILWTWVLISLELATIAMESLRLLGKEEVVSYFGYVIGGMGLFLWLYGHFPVYSSEVCDESLWYFVFIIVTLLDVVLGVVVILLCAALFCGVRFPEIKN